MTCNCESCQYGREVERNLKWLPKKKRAFFYEMYMKLVHEQMDRNYAECIIEGTWPSAREVLSRHWPELQEAKGNIQ